MLQRRGTLRNANVLSIADNKSLSNTDEQAAQYGTGNIPDAAEYAATKAFSPVRFPLTDQSEDCIELSARHRQPPTPIPKQK